MRAWLRRRREDLRSEGRTRVALRTAIPLLGLSVTAVTVWAASGQVPLPILELLLVVAVVAAAVPDTVITTILLLGHIGTWGLTVPRPDRAVDLLAPAVAGCLLLGIHLCASAIAVWPPGLAIPAGARRRWLTGAATIAGATVIAAGLGSILLAAALPGRLLLSLVALAVLAVSAVLAYLRSV